MRRRALVTLLLLACWACAPRAVVPSTAPSSAASQAGQNIEAAAPTEVCLPDDGLCLILPAGWSAASTRRTSGAVGDEVRIDLLGPDDARTILRGAPAAEAGCGPAVSEMHVNDSALPQIRLVRGVIDGSATAYLSGSSGSCTYPVALVASPAPGRLVEAQARAKTPELLDAIADALRAARWRR